MLLAALFIFSACVKTPDKPKDDIAFGTPEPTVPADGEIDYDALEIDPAAEDFGGRMEFTGGSGFTAENRPFEYSGGEMTVELTVLSELQSWEYGFALALNGVFQTTSVSIDGNDYGETVMHCVKFAPKVPRTLRFSFIPTVGKAGETVCLDIVYINNPSYKSAFNGNTAAIYGLGIPLLHHGDSCMTTVKMNADAPLHQPAAQPELETMAVPAEYVEAMEEYLSHGAPEQRDEARKQYVKLSLFSDPPGAAPGPFDAEQYLLAQNGESLTAYLEMFGEVGDYRLSIFVDHELCEIAGGTYLDIANDFETLKRAKLEIPLGGRTERGCIYAFLFVRGAYYNEYIAPEQRLPEEAYTFDFKLRTKHLFIGSIPEPDETDAPEKTETPEVTPAPPAVEAGTQLGFEKTMQSVVYTAVTEDGKLLIVDRGVTVDTAVVYDMENERVVSSFALPEHNRMDLYAGGKLIAVQNLGYDHTGVHAFDLDGNELYFIELTGEPELTAHQRESLRGHYGSSRFSGIGSPCNLIISADGTTMLFAEAKADKNGWITCGPTRLFDLATGSELGAAEFSAGGEAWDPVPILFTGERIVTESSDQETVYITVTGRNGETLKEWRFPVTDDIRPFAASVTERLVVIGDEPQSYPEKGFSGRLILLDIDALNETELVLKNPAEAKWAKLSPDGRLLLTMSGSESAAVFRLYDIETGEVVREFSLENVYGPWWQDVALIDSPGRRLFIQNYPFIENGGQKNAITMIEY